MQLIERLEKLVGHDIYIATCLGKDGHLANDGMLEEVGADYIVIRPFDESRDSSPSDTQCFLNLHEILFIDHPSHCNKCTAKSTT